MAINFQIRGAGKATIEAYKSYGEIDAGALQRCSWKF